MIRLTIEVEKRKKIVMAIPKFITASDVLQASL